MFPECIAWEHAVTFPRSSLDATVLILTSDNEGMPNVVLEALASGVPVVATDVGDLSHMLPKGCGALVPPNVDQLASAILGVLADAPAYRRAAGQNAGYHGGNLFLSGDGEQNSRRMEGLWARHRPAQGRARN